MNKLTYQEVANFFRKENCKLLSTFYKNNKQSLLYQCQCGEISTIQFAKFQQGQRCANCAGNKRYTVERLREIFTENHCSLLSDTFKNVHSTVSYICTCGRTSTIKLTHFLSGHKCKQCGFKKIGDNQRGEKNIKWNPDREQVELNKSIGKRCRTMLRRVLKETCQVKSTKTEKMLGYTTSQLRQHITQHKNWLSVKNKEWHIDHIFPIKAFLDNGITAISRINQLSNLQPLLKEDNFSKNDYYDKTKFKEWLASR